MRDGHAYSHSQLESFGNCRRQFAFKYVWRAKKTKPRGVEGFMGNRVHAVVERTFHHLAHHGVLAPLAMLLKRFRAEWKSEHPGKLHVARRGEFEDSYRDTGERSLANFHHLMSTGRVNAKPEGVEWPLDFTVAGRPFVGVIDYLGERPNDQLHRVEVRDWKTGKVKDTRNDPQLALYEIGLRQTYDDAAPYVLVHEFLAFGVTKERVATRADLGALEERIARNLDAIEREGTWAPSPSPLCGWCDFSDQCDAAR